MKTRSWYTCIGFFPDNYQRWSSFELAADADEAEQKSRDRSADGSAVICGVVAGKRKCLDSATYAH